MMPETEELVRQQPEFVQDKTGDTEGSASGSDRDEGGEQHIPPEQWLGEPDYLEKEKQDMAKGFLQALVQIFAPKPLPNTEYMELTEAESAAAQQSMERLRDTLRYLGTSGIKVVQTPAKRHKLWHVDVTTDAKRVAGKQPNRSKLRLVNQANGNADMYLSEDAYSATVDTGFVLGAGEEITLHSQDEVWVISENAGELLSVQAEYYE